MRLEHGGGRPVAREPVRPAVVGGGIEQPGELTQRHGHGQPLGPVGMRVPALPSPAPRPRPRPVPPARCVPERLTRSGHRRRTPRTRTAAVPRRAPATGPRRSRPSRPRPRPPWRRPPRRRPLPVLRAGPDAERRSGTDGGRHGERDKGEYAGPAGVREVASERRGECAQHRVDGRFGLPGERHRDGDQSHSKGGTEPERKGSVLAVQREGATRRERPPYPLGHTRQVSHSAVQTTRESFSHRPGNHRTSQTKNLFELHHLEPSRLNRQPPCVARQRFLWRLPELPTGGWPWPSFCEDQLAGDQGQGFAWRNPLRTWSHHVDVAVRVRSLGPLQ